MDKQLLQPHREARWIFGLTLAYPGISGLPHWFEMACLVGCPLLFIGLCWLMA